MQQTNQKEIDDFVYGLIDECDYKGLTAENREQVAEEIKELLIRKINEAVLEELPDSELAEIEKLLEKQTPEANLEIQNIINRNNIEVARIAAEVMVRFRMFYLKRS